MKIWQKIALGLGLVLAPAILLAQTSVSPVRTVTCSAGEFLSALANTGIFTCTAASGVGGINELTGDVTAGPGVGSQAATLANSGVSAGTYTKLTVDVKGRATVGATAACADLSDDGTACTATVGTSGATLGLLNANKTDSGTNTFTGTNTFETVVGTVSSQSGTGGSAYTFTADDCGTMVLATGASAASYTVPNSLPTGCNISVSQETAGGQVTIVAGASATFNANPHGFTKTFGQYAIITITVKSNAGSAAVFTVTGDGAT